MSKVGYELSILKPLYIYAKIKQISKCTIDKS